MPPARRRPAVIDASPESMRRDRASERLIDGRPVRIRAIRPDDKQGLVHGLHRLSAQSTYSRFFGAKRELSQRELAFLTEIDFDAHVALVAELDNLTGLIGVGGDIVCEAEPVRAAEVAFAVDDAHQNLGVATHLLHHLVGIARAAGVGEFRATVMAANRKMLDVLQHSGLVMHRRSSGGLVDVRVKLGASAARER